MKTNFLLIMTIFLCTWKVYSENTDKAPLVLQLTNLKEHQSTPVYFYLQKPIEKDHAEVKCDHDIWYQNAQENLVIVLSKLNQHGENKKWVMMRIENMKDEYPWVKARFDHPGNNPPTFPTKKNNLETWKDGNTGKDNLYEVKSYIPATSNMKSSAEIQEHLDSIAKNYAKAEITEYIKTKLRDHEAKLRNYEFESLRRKYSKMNILLKVTTKKKEFDNELNEFKKTWYPKEKNLPLYYQREVDKMRMTFDTRDYWIKGITVTVVLIIIVICIVLRIVCSQQVEPADDMTNDETSDTYDEENPPPMPRISNSENSDSESVCLITPVISRTLSNTDLSLLLLSSEDKIDHPTTDEHTHSLQSAEKVSNDIVTQQATDTDTLFSSKNIFDIDTKENTNSLKSAEEKTQ